MSPRDVARSVHPNCVACSPQNVRGYKLHFQRCEDGSVESCFKLGSDCEGFPGLVHGGLISLLLDSAMTHCIFANRLKALTAELVIRFSIPVQTNVTGAVKARIVRDHPRLYVLEAEVYQNGTKKANATGRFRIVR